MRASLSRRRFLQAASLVGLAPTIPTFLAKTSWAAPTEKEQPILVVVQLDGGNDGLNTVVPFADEGYAKHRQQLQLPTANLHKLDDSIGLHQQMQGLSQLWQDGNLAIVNGVSYPNPSQSHDVSMSVWQTGRPDSRDVLDYGWLGRSLDQLKEGPGSDAVFTEQRAKPLALTGRKCITTSLTDAKDMQLHAQLQASTGQDSDGDLQQFLSRSTLDAYATSEQLQGLALSEDSDVPYPETEFSQRLKLISSLIKSGWQSRVYYAVQGGYDTHAGQLFTHARLLRRLSDALLAFQKDLQATGLADRVVTMCFSEFGRRVAENGSAGTDHGTAGPVFVFGSKVQGGLYGDIPSLLELENGNLKTAVDFRQIYATLLERWLEVNSENVLGGPHSAMEFLQA